MDSKYPCVPLGDVANVRSGYSFKSKDWQENGIPVIKIANVKNGNLVLDGCSYVSEEVAFTAKEFELSPGDILIAMTGYVGDVALVRDEGRLLLNQRVGRFSIIDDGRLDPGFLFYFLRMPATRDRFEQLGYGSAQANISPRLILSIPIFLPSLHEQRSIAEILGALDDKIELNRKTNATLDELARTIFRSWFVDFDPARAKAEGREPFGMGAEIAAIFPDRFVESEHGPIPEGWKIKPLDKIADFLNGLALQKYPPRGDESDLPVIKIAQLRINSTVNASMANDDVPGQYVVKDGDFLFSWSGSLLAEIWTGGRGALNQHLFKVTSNSYPQWFVYQWVQRHLDHFRQIAASKATTMGHINRRHLSEALCVVPETELLEACGKVIEDLMSLAIQNSLESRTLAELRNTLLPELISGRTRVPEAEKAVAEVV